MANIFAMSPAAPVALFVVGDDVFYRPSGDDEADAALVDRGLELVERLSVRPPCADGRDDENEDAESDDGAPDVAVFVRDEDNTCHADDRRQ